MLRGLPSASPLNIGAVWQGCCGNLKFARDLLCVLLMCGFVPQMVSALEYTRQGDALLVSGEVFSNDLRKFKRAIRANPNVKTLVFLDVPGSADDATNVQIVRLIRELGLNTHLTRTSHVASGGTDLFIGGVKRTMERGAKIGVHSWSDGTRDGADFPDESSEHDMFIELYDDLNVAEEFYWFTLDAAAADDMHYMTVDEIRDFGILTEPMKE